MRCKECGEEVEQLVTVRVGKRTLKLCEDCAGRKREELEIAEGAESKMRELMEYKGR